MTRAAPLIRRLSLLPLARPASLLSARLLADMLLSALLMAGVACAQVITPRRKVAAVYKEPDLESIIISEVEPNGRWRLDFSGAEIATRLPDEAAGGPEIKFLLPGRDNGSALMAHVRGPGKKNDGWVDPEKIEISPDAAWKIPTTSVLFVPLRARQIPPLRAGSLPAALPAASLPAGSWMLLVDPEGRVAGVRPVADPAPAAAVPAADAATIEAALRQFRFAPMRFEGEPVHVLLAVRLVAARR